MEYGENSSFVSTALLSYLQCVEFIDIAVMQLSGVRLEL